MWKDKSMEGKKFDSGKLSWSLLPFDAVKEIVKILDHGAKKYAPDNWKKVVPFKQRYFDALMRHLVAWQNGETVDKDSGLPTMAHVACNALFLLWGDIQEKESHKACCPCTCRTEGNTTYVCEEHTKNV